MFIGNVQLPVTGKIEYIVLTINNYPVTIEDAHNANTSYSCNITPLKGKKVCQQPKRICAKYIEVPGSLRESIGNMTVAAEVMVVNGILFLVSISRGANSTMAEYVN